MRLHAAITAPHRLPAAAPATLPNRIVEERVATPLADTTTVVPVTHETYTLDPEFWSRHPRLLDGWPAETSETPA